METEYLNKEQQQIRQKFWMDVYLAYVGSSNSTRISTGAEWADIALEEFDKRFNK